MSRRSALRTERNEILLNRFHSGGERVDSETQLHHHDELVEEGKEGWETEISGTDSEAKQS